MSLHSEPVVPLTNYTHIRCTHPIADATFTANNYKLASTNLAMEC